MTSTGSDQWPAKLSFDDQSVDALPRCCNSGCTVCVLDYPELFLPQRSAEVLGLSSKEMFDAIALAGRLLDTFDLDPTSDHLKNEGGL